MAPASLSVACLPISHWEAAWVAPAAPAVGTRGGSGAGPLAGWLLELLRLCHGPCHALWHLRACVCVPVCYFSTVHVLFNSLNTSIILTETHYLA